MSAELEIDNATIHQSEIWEWRTCRRIMRLRGRATNLLNLLCEVSRQALTILMRTIRTGAKFLGFDQSADIKTRSDVNSEAVKERISAISPEAKFH